VAAVNDPGVVEWLRGPAGEQWSRDRALAGDPGPVVDMQVLWRATGPLRQDLDPCGSGPVQVRGGGDG
jgi:hypothetical protein